MAYLVGNGAILEFSIRGSYGEQTFISIFHYKYETTLGDTDGRALIEAVNPLINAAGVEKLVGAYAADLHVDALLIDVVYQWVYPTRRSRVVKVPAALTGALAGVGAPPNLAMALTKRSDVAGRAGVGTLHMPALIESAFEKGRFTNMGRDQYGQLQQRIKESILVEFDQSLVPVIYHRANPAASAEINDCLNNETVRTMHRRTVGLGI